MEADAPRLPPAIAYDPTSQVVASAGVDSDYVRLRTLSLVGIFKIRLEEYLTETLLFFFLSS